MDKIVCAFAAILVLMLLLVSDVYAACIVCKVRVSFYISLPANFSLSYYLYKKNMNPP